MRKGIAILAERDLNGDFRVEIHGVVEASGLRCGFLGELYVLHERGRLRYAAASESAALYVAPELAVATLCLRDVTSPCAIKWHDDVVSADVERERIASFLEKELRPSYCLPERVRAREHWEP